MLQKIRAGNPDKDNVVAYELIFTVALYSCLSSIAIPRKDNAKMDTVVPKCS